MAGTFGKRTLFGLISTLYEAHILEGSDQVRFEASTHLSFIARSINDFAHYPFGKRRTFPGSMSCRSFRNTFYHRNLRSIPVRIKVDDDQARIQTLLRQGFESKSSAIGLTGIGLGQNSRLFYTAARKRYLSFRWFLPMSLKHRFPKQHYSAPRRVVCLLMISLAVFQMGCVSRRMTFVSNPPGAMVLLEGKEIGYSPASADFIYYGTRQVTMIKDGYETKTEFVTVPAPWYQWPGIEFFADNFSLHRVNDRRYFKFDLQPKQMVPDDDLRARARQLRSEAQIGQ